MKLGYVILIGLAVWWFWLSDKPVYHPNWLVIIASLVGVNIGYKFCDKFMRQIPKYHKVEEERQKYIVKNVVKGLYLMGLTIYAIPYGYDMLFNDVWPSGKMQTLVFLYAIPDLVGLIRVKNLHWMTKVHHTLVLFLATSSLWVKFTDTYWQWYLTYGLLSMFAWFVNLFLGFWRLLPLEYYRRLAAAAALLNYLCCLAANWSWQTLHTIKWIYKAENRSDYAGMFFGSIILFLIAADDILLVISLVKHVYRENMLKR